MRSLAGARGPFILQCTILLSSTTDWFSHLILKMEVLGPSQTQHFWRFEVLEVAALFDHFTRFSCLGMLKNCR